MNFKFDRNTSGTLTLQGRVQRLEIAVQLVIMAVAVAVIGVILTGCTSATGDYTSGEEQFNVKTVIVNGRQVPCIVWVTQGVEAGGIQCDWNAK